jgi:hypothetical protein
VGAEKPGEGASSNVCLTSEYKTKNPDSAMNRDFVLRMIINYNTSFTSLYGKPKASETPL